MITRSEKQPIYQQLIDSFRDFAQKSEPGTALPSENAISQRYGVARMTVSRAFNHLVEEGIVYRERGRGTFVSQRKDSPVYYVFPSHETWRKKPTSSTTDVYYGVHQRALELGISIDTLMASPDNLCDNIDKELFMQLPNGSSVIVSGVWFKNIFKLLREKQCRVGYICHQAEDTFCHEHEITHWQIVQVDRTGIMQDVVHHLHKQGCRNIAFLHESSHFLHPYRVGLRNALATKNLERHEELELFCADDIGSSYEYTIQLLEMRKRYPFDAIITGTASQAIGVYQALRDAKISIPDDVCLVSLRDDKNMYGNSLPISAVSYPYAKAGALALEKVIAQSYEPGKQVLSCQFNERASSCRNKIDLTHTVKTDLNNRFSETNGIFFKKRNQQTTEAV